MLPLSMLAIGERALVSAVLGAPDHVQRLYELGIALGHQVEVIQSGSPCVIRVQESKLCFRETDAMSVLVQPGVLADGQTG